MFFVSNKGLGRVSVLKENDTNFLINGSVSGNLLMILGYSDSGVVGFNFLFFL